MAQPEEVHNSPTIFPKGFFWGASTASHQVEGGTKNDWSEWEKKNATRLAKEAESKFRFLANWKEIAGDATNPENYISGEACDHYHRYKEDFTLAKELLHTATRFSIEWSRIEPRRGVFSEEGIAHYRQIVATCREMGLEPFVTLNHWTLPLWLSDEGGFSSSKFPHYFARFTQKVVTALGEQVTFWITLNEPDVVSSYAYIKGAWPPQKKSFVEYYVVLKNLIKAHRAAYQCIKKIQPKASVGIAKHQVVFEIKRRTFVNKVLFCGAQYFWNRWFLHKIVAYQDFIGLNFYERNVIDNGFHKNENLKVTDMGWEFYPDALYEALVELKQYKKPIYITENGLADAKDMQRGEFITRSVKAIERALGAGVDVRGYLYWSLLDNFEWDKGFWPRFGLIEVDYKTKARTIRPSAYTYRDIIKQHTYDR
jgi:beta-glucosidase